jgi:AraC-like DNA-binding protein
MSLLADSTRICSEYKPESVQCRAQHDGVAMLDQVVDAPAAARRIRPAVVYMSQNLGTPLRVKTLSALLGLSSSHFFHLFKRATGYSPIDFFNRMRVRRAIELLEDTTLRMKEVAALLGYADQFYFSRVFKSVNGVAPSEYRVLAPEFREAVRKTAWPWTSNDGLDVDTGAMLTHRCHLPNGRHSEAPNVRTLPLPERSVVSAGRERVLKP